MTAKKKKPAKKPATAKAKSLRERLLDCENARAADKFQANLVREQLQRELNAMLRGRDKVDKQNAMLSEELKELRASYNELQGNYQSMGGSLTKSAFAENQFRKQLREVTHLHEQLQNKYETQSAVWRKCAESEGQLERKVNCLISVNDRLHARIKELEECTRFSEQEQPFTVDVYAGSVQ